MRRQARIFTVIGSLLVVSLVWADGQPQESESDPAQSEVVEVQLEKEHLHALDGPIAKLIKGRENFIASDGRYLGIASMGSEPFAKVYILRDGRIDSKLTLQPPPSEDLNLFGFAFADGGTTEGSYTACRSEAEASLVPGCKTCFAPGTSERYDG